MNHCYKYLIPDGIKAFKIKTSGIKTSGIKANGFKVAGASRSRLHYGVEYWYRGALALRTGYKSNYDEENWTFGAGLRGVLQDYAFQFDYAFNQYGVFDPVHKFTAGLEF